MYKKFIAKSYLLLGMSLVMLLGTAAPGIVRAEVSNNAKDITTSRANDINKPQVLQLNKNVASMTEKRTLNASFKLPQGVDLKNINWTYDGKPLP
jgi:hypothetical protein